MGATSCAPARRQIRSDPLDLLWTARTTRAMGKPGRAAKASNKPSAPKASTGITKTSWALAGFDRWPGHTEYLQSKTRAKRVAMMFHAEQINTVLATIHIPLMDIRNQLTIGRVFDAIDLGNDAMKQLGIAKPKIAVCGLNPHAGEDGLFGDEELLDKRSSPVELAAGLSGGHEVVRIETGDILYVEDDEGRVFRLEVGHKPSASRRMLTITRTR